MPDKKPGSRPRPAAAPDQVKLTAMQAQRLAAVSDVTANEIEGLTVADVGDKLRWRIDPELLRFRKICGRVVKKDPVTGVEYPVPYATVEVQDTDCSLIGYFPRGSRWAWYFPFGCRREVIATVKTDRCGKFCVYLPWFDVDWVVRWRKLRLCSPIIFERPTIADLLDDVVIREPLRVPPKPDPDPDPSWLLHADRGRLLSNVEQRLGRGVARRLAPVVGRAAFGVSTAAAAAVLQEDAFEIQLPPPLPEELRVLARDSRDAGGDRGRATEGARRTIAARLNVDPAALAELDVRRAIGPFRRCVDVFLPEWVPFLDVPDITFRVTQDVDGDGDEETIYGESLFQVRWNAGSLPDVKLVASPIAVAIPDCGDMLPVIPCGNTPELSIAGRMPVRGDLTMYNPVEGYAVRPNRPHPGGGGPTDSLPRPAAETPFAGVVPIFGCVDVDTPATHYRILDSYSADGEAFTPFLPVLGHAWPVTRLDATNTVAEYHTVTPDGAGWYPIVIPKGANPNDWFPPNLVIDWNTFRVGEGKHILKIELGSGGVPLAPQPTTDPVAFHVQNADPEIHLAVEYRVLGSPPSDWQPITFPCPVINRGSTPRDVQFRVSFNASSSHLRDVSFGSGGCGGGNPLLTSETPMHWYADAAMRTLSHWHIDVDDNSVAVMATFQLAASALQGTYSFGCNAARRAINPNGADGGHLQMPPFEYDTAGYGSVTGVAFSVINAD